MDTLHKISDIDLHGGVLSGWFNPHAAVPSMHFGYALMIGMVGFVLLRSWPLRLIALAYPVLVFITITGTGNHYVLDAVAGGDRDRHGLRRRLGAHAGLPARPHAPRAGPRHDALDHLDPLTAGRPRRRPTGRIDDVRTERLRWLTLGVHRSITPVTWTSEPSASRPESASVRRDPSPATISSAGA